MAEETPKLRRATTGALAQVLRAAARRFSNNTQQPKRSQTLECQNPQWNGIEGSWALQEVDSVNSLTEAGFRACSPPKCLNGHTLQFHIPETLLVWCNTCFQPINAQSIGCRECVFDVCLDNCYETFFRYGKWMRILLKGDWKDLLATDDEHEPPKMNTSIDDSLSELDRIISSCLWYSMVFDQNHFVPLLQRVRELGVSEDPPNTAVMINDTVRVHPAHLLSSIFAVYCGMANELPEKYFSLFVHDILASDARCSPVFDNNRPVRMSARDGHLPLLNHLLSLPGVDPASADSYAFRKACAKGFMPIVERLLEDGRVDPAANSNEALRFACEEGHLEITRLLLRSPQVDPTVNDHLCSWIAASNGHLDVVEVLLQDNRTGLDGFESSFLGCVFMGEERVFNWIMEQEQISVVLSKIQILEFVIRNAPRGIVEKVVRYPQLSHVEKLLPSLARKAYLDLFKELLHQLDVCSETSNPGSRVLQTTLDEALNNACECSRVGLVKFLLRDGRANIFMRNGNCFYLAAVRGHHEVLKALLDDPRLSRDLSQRLNECLQIAAERGHVKVVEYLCTHPFVNPSHSKCSALLSAVITCELSTVLLFLQQPCVLDYIFSGEEQPPIIAKAVRRGQARIGQADFIRALLSIDCTSPDTVRAGAQLALTVPRENPAGTSAWRPGGNALEGENPDGPRPRLLGPAGEPPREGKENPDGPRPRLLDPAACGGKAFETASTQTPVDPDIVRLLLRDPRVSPSAQQMGEALRFACSQGYTSVLELYVDEAAWRHRRIASGSALEGQGRARGPLPALHQLVRSVRVSSSRPRFRSRQTPPPIGPASGPPAFSALDIDPAWHHQSMVRSAVRNAQYDTARFLRRLEGTRWDFAANLCVRITATRGMLVALVHATAVEAPPEGPVSEANSRLRKVMQHQAVSNLLPRSWQFSLKRMLRIEKRIGAQTWMTQLLKVPYPVAARGMPNVALNEHERFAVELLQMPQVRRNKGDVPLAFKHEWFPVVRLLQGVLAPSSFLGLMTLTHAADDCDAPVPPSLLQVLVEEWLPLVVPVHT